jgi:urocanate hydratase
MGVVRHADAGYELAKATAKEHGLDLYARLHGE